jgi:hypothetical protein
VINTPSPTQERFIDEMLSERREQDAQWRGPDHDDEHKHEDWRRYIRHQLRSGGDFEMRMKKVAALAMAAYESSRRKHEAGA